MFQCLLKVINCYYDSRSRKYMKIQSVLTHREILSICYVIIFIVELKGRRFEWCESFNIYVRRIIWIRSHIFTFRASDFADNQIIPYGEIILFETQGQASLKPWIYHINKSQSENNIERCPLVTDVMLTKFFLLLLNLSWIGPFIHDLFSSSLQK